MDKTPFPGLQLCPVDSSPLLPPSASSHEAPGAWLRLGMVLVILSSLQVSASLSLIRPRGVVRKGKIKFGRLQACEERPYPQSL